MATSNKNTGRTLPAGGVDGQVVVTDTTTPTDTAWGDASDILFTNPSQTTGDWPGTDPTTIGQALNLLAARLNALEA